MRFIDTHTHVVSADTTRYPTDPLRNNQSDWSKEHHADGDVLVKEMDVAGVEKAFVVQASTAYGFDNSFCNDSVAKHPDRLVGVGSIDFLGANNARDLTQLVDNPNFIGCRIYTAGDSNPDQADWRLDDERTFPAWQVAQEREFPVVISMQMSAIPEVEVVLERFPQVRIIIDNCCRPNLDGGPPYEKSKPIFALNRFENLFFKMMSGGFHRAASAPGGAPAIMRGALFDHFGPNRIAWGSNFPGTDGSLAELVEFAQTATTELTDAERQAFFYDNAFKLYPALK